MKLKKLLSLALALSMALSLAACGSGSTSTPASSGSGSDASTSQSAGEVKGLTPEERAKEFITVGTGPTSGIYFPIGGAFATALKDYGYQTSAEATNATGQNIQNIRNGEAEIRVLIFSMTNFHATVVSSASAGRSTNIELCPLWFFSFSIRRICASCSTGS